MALPENTGFLGFPNVRELPYYSWTEWDSISAVKTAMQRLEVGYFDQPAMLVDQMTRDDRISGCLMTRAEALPSLPLNFKPGKGKTAQKVSDSVQANWKKMFPDAAVTELLKWAIMLGIGVGENVWARDEESGLVRQTLKVWHPRFLYWRWDSRSYWLQTESGTIEITPGDGQWVLLAPHGLNRAWMSGKARSLYIAWLLRQWSLRDSGRYSEVYGHPIKKARVPASARDEDKNRFFKEVAALASESTVRLPAGSDGVSFDIELLEAVGNGFEGFDRLVNSASTNIAIALLGQNLSTEVKGGSHAAAAVHESIRGDILRGDSDKLTACLAEQSLKYFLEFNFGNLAPEARPEVTYDTKPPEDTQAAADTLVSVGTAVLSLRQAGIPLDGKKLAARFNVPTPDGFDGELEAMEPPEAAPTPPEAPPKKGAKPMKAKLAQRVDKQVLEHQLRIDELGDEALKASTLDSAREVQKLANAVEGATDFDDLRRKVLDAFAGLDTAQLTQKLAQAFLLADLEGRFAVVSEE